MMASRVGKALHPRTVTAGAMAVLVLAGATRAPADPVGLQVVDRESGRVLRVWRHDGRLYVAGEPGARYAIRLSNHTDGRVLVVLSVDGVNAITGQTAGYDQRGYLFDPHESYDVDGWRKSQTEVAAFTFAPLSQSYAARTGRPGDVGVIGIAVFNERKRFAGPPHRPAPKPFWRPLGATQPGPATEVVVPQRRTDAPTRAGVLAPAAALPAPPSPAVTPAPSPQSVVVTGSRIAKPPSLAGHEVAEPLEEKLGTAHGAREWSVTNIVGFVRATPYPQWVQQVEYDTYDDLVARGVLPPSRQGERPPRAFPQASNSGGYVADPPER